MDGFFSRSVDELRVLTQEELVKHALQEVMEVSFTTANQLIFLPLCFRMHF
jgi:hypothetical protein